MTDSALKTFQVNTLGDLRAALEAYASNSVHNDTPVLVELEIRSWHGKFIFNPKSIEFVTGHNSKSAPARLVINMANGHCVTKTLSLVAGRLSDIAYANDADHAADNNVNGAPIDIHVSDKDGAKSSIYGASMTVRWEPADMAIKIAPAEQPVPEATETTET